MAVLVYLLVLFSASSSFAAQWCGGLRTGGEASIKCLQEIPPPPGFNNWQQYEARQDEQRQQHAVERERQQHEQEMERLRREQELEQERRRLQAVQQQDVQPQIQQTQPQISQPPSPPVAQPQPVQPQAVQQIAQREQTPEQPAEEGWLKKTAQGLLMLIAGIGLAAGLIIYLTVKDSEETAKREKENREKTIKEVWKSEDNLIQALKDHEHLLDQSKGWATEHWQKHRERDVRENVYNLDDLWDIWKYYARRKNFDAEVNTLIRSPKNPGWTEKQIKQFMKLYVRETKARWELLKAREHEKTFSSSD